MLAVVAARLVCSNGWPWNQLVFSSVVITSWTVTTARAHRCPRGGGVRILGVIAEAARHAMGVKVPQRPLIDVLAVADVASRILGLLYYMYMY